VYGVCVDDIGPASSPLHPLSPPSSKQLISNLYTPATLNKYKNKRPYENPPHVYALAEKAYKELKETHKPQCVLVSGESGAGKTENAKKIMEYITNVAVPPPLPGNKRKNKDKTQKDDAAASIKDKILRSNVLLEAFGNAKTLRNDNSSRFGKLMEILFDYGGGIVGGKVTSYLLEKVRRSWERTQQRRIHLTPPPLADPSYPGQRRRAHVPYILPALRRLRQGRVRGAWPGHP
jgi:myosin I